MLVGKTKIALLWSRYGGPTTSVNDLVLGLDRSRFDVMFIYLCGREAGANLCEKAGHEVVHLTKKQRTQFYSPLVVLKLARVLRQHHVDILHCHTHTPTVYGVLAACLAGTPVVLAHVHGLGRTRNLRRRLMNLMTFRRMARMICVADAVRQDVIKTNWWVNPEKLLVLENSVDYERFGAVCISPQEAKGKLGLPADSFVFGTMGRLVPTKGLPYLLDAFSMVRQQVPSAQLVLLGEGASRATLAQQAAKMPCRDAIHFLGHRSGVEELLRGLDVFVLSSVAEGMPRAILEAMAGGIPCVATAVGGIPEIFRQSDGGLLVPPRDATALAQTMIQIARMTEQQRAAIGAVAQERIRQSYSHDVIREKLRAMYENEIEGFRCRHPDRV